MRYGSSTRTSECSSVWQTLQQSVTKLGVLRAESSRRLRWRRRSLWRRVLLLHSLLEDEASTEAGEYDSNFAFFDQTESKTQTANRSVQPFCTAHGRKSLYFTMGAPFPKNSPSLGGESGPHLMHGALPVCCRTGRRCSTS